MWEHTELITLIEDCATNGVQAVSFGGGEPLQFKRIFDVLDALDGVVFRSMTTNGLQLDRLWSCLVAVRPDKVHVSIHVPDRISEVKRVIRQVVRLADEGIASGVNLLVQESTLGAAAEAAERLHMAGITNDRIVYLPMRSQDTPTPKMLAMVAGSDRFQSMSCLLGCAASPRFASIGWDKGVGWCSYTESRRKLPSLDHTGLVEALTGLELVTC